MSILLLTINVSVARVLHRMLVLLHENFDTCIEQGYFIFGKGILICTGNYNPNYGDQDIILVVIHRAVTQTYY